jgi:WD40 repeat protein
VSKESKAAISPFWSVAFSPDGKRLAAGGYKEVRLWDLEANTSQVIGKTSGPVRALAWNSDGTQLAAGSGQPGVGGEVLIVTGMLSGADPTRVATLKEHRDVVESVAFMPNGAVASAGIDERALVTELPAGKVLRALADHTNRVVAVTVTSTGKYLLTGSLDKTVKVWSATDYLPLANIDANVGQVNALAALPGSESFAVAGEDGNIRLFRLQESKTGNLTSISGQQQRTIGGNRTPILSLAASAKGNVLVSGGADKTVGVFDLSGNRKQTFKDCTDLVYGVAASADGTLVAAGCRDGKARVWSAKDGVLIAELVR